MRDKKITKEAWEELKEKAYILGDHYEREYRGCGQCVLAAVFDTLNIHSEEVFRAATGLSGGQGLVGDATCSALTGAILFFGMNYPRRRSHFDDDRENKYRTYRMAQKLRDRYLQEYGSTRCHDIHAKIMGRAFDLRNSQDRKEFEISGAHVDKCTQVVALAARWAVEIFAEEKMLDDSQDKLIV